MLGARIDPPDRPYCGTVESLEAGLWRAVRWLLWLFVLGGLGDLIA